MKCLKWFALTGKEWNAKGLLHINRFTTWFCLILMTPICLKPHLVLIVPTFCLILLKQFIRIPREWCCKPAYNNGSHFTGLFILKFNWSKGTVYFNRNTITKGLEKRAKQLWHGSRNINFVIFETASTCMVQDWLLFKWFI